MVKQYNIDAIADADGYVYICINKGMYGFKQADVLV